MTFGVGQAEQSMHRGRFLAVQHNAVPKIAQRRRCDRSTVVIHQLKLNLTALTANGQIQNPLQSSRRVHHSHVKCVARQR